MKKKLLYIGHPYHLKSRSIDFLKQALERSYDVEYLCAADDCSIPEESIVPLDGREFEVCVCFQVMPSVVMLKRHVAFRFGVFFPMADYYYGMLPVGTPVWEEYRNFKIVSFSKKVHDELTDNGFDSVCMRYFPKPVDVGDWGDERSVFFWQRITHLNVYAVLDVLKNFPIRHLRLHRAIDPGEQEILCPLAHQREFGVSYSTWYDTRDEMLRDMDRYSIYFAPRKVEGIGLGYLEAMARGRCVFAHDDTTHNEYIVHGETGFLYDLNSHDKTVDVSVEDVRRVQRNALEFIRKGHEEWLRELDALPAVLETPAKPDMSKARAPASVDPCSPAAYLQDPTNCAAGAKRVFAAGLPRRLWRWAKRRFRHGGNWRCVKKHSVLGVPLALKYVREDGRAEKICVLGVPVVMAEILDA